MSGVSRLPTVREIEEEAAAWVWRLDDDTVSAQDRKAFDEWVRRDSRHRRAFEELGGVWCGLDVLAEAKRDEKIATFARLPEMPLGEAAAVVRRPSKIWPYAMAASLLVGISVVLWLRHGNEAQIVATAVGQQRAVVLADGSIVDLNTNTILETDLDRDRRVVRLRKGEVLLNVAADRRRPFLVYAGGAVVRAIGTRFNVRVRDTNGAQVRGVEVIVAEGRVAVSYEPAGDKQGVAREKTITLNARQRLDTSADLPIAQMNTSAISKTLAWRDGAIVFDGDTLGEAIAELNRYTDMRLIVGDSRLQDMKVGGRFKAGDIDDFLLAMSRALPISTRRAADSNLVYIEYRLE